MQCAQAARRAARHEVEWCAVHAMYAGTQPLQVAAVSILGVHVLVWVGRTGVMQGVQPGEQPANGWCESTHTHTRIRARIHTRTGYCCKTWRARVRVRVHACMCVCARACVCLGIITRTWLPVGGCIVPDDASVRALPSTRKAARAVHGAPWHGKFASRVVHGRVCMVILWFIITRQHGLRTMSLGRLAWISHQLSAGFV